MTQEPWFEGENDFDDIQAEFLSALVDRAVAGWQAQPDDIELALPDYQRYGYVLGDGSPRRGKLLVYCDVVDPSNTVLLTAGTYLDRDHVHGDEIHGQLFTLPETPTRLALRATGTPAELGTLTADWFGTVLGRPIRHREQR